MSARPPGPRLRTPHCPIRGPGMTPSHLRRPRPAAGALASYRARSESGAAGRFVEILNAAELTDRVPLHIGGRLVQPAGQASGGVAPSLWRRGEPEYCSRLGGGRDSEPNSSLVGRMPPRRRRPQMSVGSARGERRKPSIYSAVEACRDSVRRGLLPSAASSTAAAMSLVRRASRRPLMPAVTRCGRARRTS